MLVCVEKSDFSRTTDFPEWSENVGHFFEHVLTWWFAVYAGLCFMQTLYASDCERHRNALKSSAPMGILFRSQNNESGFNLKFQEGQELRFLYWVLQAGGTF
ncbi:hypothetical protein K0M31_001182 [Melipona bicolor]|uniref:Uncharacterized protein n=1 Tax=Melipona bicolor TaxID=60889 RepID=A0AA40KXY7_9HYME|nr:hypothetical protein K0M31_001182 [Melipona bicolor]